jgi:hypothetical protein
MSQDPDDFMEFIAAAEQLREAHNEAWTQWRRYVLNSDVQFKYTEARAEAHIAVYFQEKERALFAARILLHGSHDEALRWAANRPTHRLSRG